MTELARAIQDWFNPHWTETRPTVRESSPEAATVGPRKEKLPMPEPTPFTREEEEFARGVAKLLTEGGMTRTARLFATLDRERGINVALVDALEAAQERIDIEHPRRATIKWDTVRAQIAAALALAKPKE